jgi:hypothetical protein
MEKNWLVSVGFYERNGGYEDSCSWSKEYGPYSQEDAERIASQLNEKRNDKHHFFHLFSGAVARMLEAKDFDGIFADIKSETEKHLGPIPSRAESRNYKRQLRERKKNKTARYRCPW